MMTDIELSALYRRLNKQGGLPPLDADRIVRLARGEPADADHDEAVTLLANSPLATDLYRLARALEPEAELLASRLRSSVHARPAPRVLPKWTRWTLAAGILGMAVLAGRGWVDERPDRATPSLATDIAPPQGTVFSADFEPGTSTASTETSIFNGGFDS